MRFLYRHFKADVFDTLDMANMDMIRESDNPCS